MDYHEKRERGRLRVSQPLTISTAKRPEKRFKAVSFDVSEVNIGFATEANLAMGEQIVLELKTQTCTVKVKAVVLRKNENSYGCKFLEEDNLSFYCVAGK